MTSDTPSPLKWADKWTVNWTSSTSIPAMLARSVQFKITHDYKKVMHYIAPLKIYNFSNYVMKIIVFFLVSTLITVLVKIVLNSKVFYNWLYSFVLENYNCLRISNLVG